VVNVAYSLDDLLKKAQPKLEGVHPSVQACALQLITKAYAKGVKLIITQGLRTIEEQNKLYAKGRTTAQLRAVGITGISGNPSAAIVTKAKGGTSYHNYGLAFDIGILRTDEKDVDWTDSKYRPIGALGKELGLEWGGDFKSIKDTPHYQLSFGLSIADLQSGKRPKGSTVSVHPGVQVVKMGSEGALTKETQINLNKLGFDSGDPDGIAGTKTVEAIKDFQAKYGLSVDGIAGRDTLAKLKELAAEKAVEVKEEAEKKDLPKVESFGGTPIRVTTITDAGVYAHADISGKSRTIKKGTTFRVYGNTYAAWAVNDGFVQMKDVEPEPMTIHTGGVNIAMQTELKRFMSGLNKDTVLIFKSEGGNPYAEITAKGLVLVQILRYLNANKWYYKEAPKA
jgi:hypothetical protein